MAEISDPIGTVLQGYLEVLYLACDLNSQWTSSDLHAAFEWALTLHKLASDLSKSAALASTAENLKPSLPYIIQDTLEAAIKSPTQVLLRRLLVHGNNLKLAAPRPDWTLKVLAAHTSACSLPEPSLAKDVHIALAHIRETDICESLLNAAHRDGAVAVAASSVQQLAAGAPSWVPFPAAIASEYLAYFSKSSTLELTAAAAVLLRQQQQYRKKEEESVVETIAGSAAMRAELLAMALCLPLPQPKPSPKDVQKDAAILPQARAESAGEESAKRKLTERLPQDPLALALCSLLRSTPSLAISLPSPLLARACRSSYPLSIEYAAALEKLREDNTVASTAVISALKQACLFDDTTALVFKDALDAMYRSI